MNLGRSRDAVVPERKEENNHNDGSECGECVRYLLFLTSPWKPVTREPIDKHRLEQDRRFRKRPNSRPPLRGLYLRNRSLAKGTYLNNLALLSQSCSLLEGIKAATTETQAVMTLWDRFPEIRRTVKLLEFIRHLTLSLRLGVGV